MKRINKSGSWQDYLLPAIMAILVLGISFYFIFNEFFTGEDLEREVCKESVMVRAAMPELKKADLTFASLRKDFPLKCKTRVIEITEKDVNNGRVDNIIGDALAECWYIFGVGDSGVFPSSVYGDNTACLPCARIHLTNEAKDVIVKNSTMNGKIDIQGILNDVNLFNIGGKKTSYLNYLNGVGERFYPFNPMGTGEFDLGGENFSIEDVPWSKNRDFPDFSNKLDPDIDEWGAFGQVHLPKYFNVSLGDLIIVVGEATTSENVEYDYAPYMFYFQNGQKNYLDEMDNNFYSGDTKLTANLFAFSKPICNSWEGIPA